MKILVLIKAVPMETDVRMTENNIIDREKALLNLNLSDEAAAEAAFMLAAAAGEGSSVTVLTMGTVSAEPILRDLIARGASEAVLLTDRALAGSDTYATAKALAAAIRTLGTFDYIFCGRKAMDGETGQVPAEIAVHLGVPCVTNVRQSALYSGRKKSFKGMLDCIRILEDGEEETAVPSGAVVTFCEYSYHLRLPGIRGMRNAREKEIRRLSLFDIGLTKEEAGLSGSPTRVVRSGVLESGKRKGPRETDPEKGAEEILRLIREVNA